MNHRNCSTRQRFISFVDGIQINPSDFNLHTDGFLQMLSLSLTSDATKVRVVVDHYTVPALEVKIT